MSAQQRGSTHRVSAWRADEPNLKVQRALKAGWTPDDFDRLTERLRTTDGYGEPDLVLLDRDPHLLATVRPARLMDLLDRQEEARARRWKDSDASRGPLPADAQMPNLVQLLGTKVPWPLVEAVADYRLVVPLPRLCAVLPHAGYRNVEEFAGWALVPDLKVTAVLRWEPDPLTPLSVSAAADGQVLLDRIGPWQRAFGHHCYWWMLLGCRTVTQARARSRAGQGEEENVRALLRRRGLRLPTFEPAS